jgi:hypothetical protein
MERIGKSLERLPSDRYSRNDLAPRDQKPCAIFVSFFSSNEPLMKSWQARFRTMKKPDKPLYFQNLPG